MLKRTFFFVLITCLLNASQQLFSQNRLQLPLHGSDVSTLSHDFGSGLSTPDNNPAIQVRRGGPSNDQCFSAIPLFCGQPYSGTTTGATTTGQPTTNCVGVPDAGGVWHSIVGSGSDITISLCGSSYDTKMNVYFGSCSNLLCRTGNDDFCSLQSEVTFTAFTGITYYILVNGFNGAQGDYSIVANCTETNDVCNLADPISCGQTITGLTSGSSPSGIPNLSCSGISPGAPGKWYRYLGTGDLVTFSTCGSSYDTRLHIYGGSCNSLSCYNANDNSCGTGSEVTLFSNLNQAYFIFVNGANNATGTFRLSIQCEDICAPIPGNDQCRTAFDLPVQHPSNCQQIQGTNRCASLAEITPSCDAGGTLEDVWYTFNSGPNTDLTFNFQAMSSGPLSFALYDNCGTTDLANACRVSGDWNITGFNPNRQYWLQLWTDPTNFGVFRICLSGDTVVAPPPPPPTCNAPTGLETLGIKTNSADFNWFCDSDVEYYILRGNIVGRSGFVTLQVPPGCGNLPIRVSGLRPGTTYWWELQAVCDEATGNVSGWSSRQQFTTTVSCSEPSNLQTLAITNRSARLIWEALNNAVGYRVRGRQLGGPWTVIELNGQNSTSLNTGNTLQPGTTYEWKVATLCTAGFESDESPSVIFTTQSSKAQVAALNKDDAIELNVYPNPARDHFVVKSALFFGGTERHLKVFDSRGMMVYTDKVPANGELLIHTKQWMSGIYQVVLEQETGSTTKRIVVGR